MKDLRKIKIKDIFIVYNFLSSNEIKFFEEIFTKFTFTESTSGIPEKPNENHAGLDWSQANGDENLSRLATEAIGILVEKNTLLKTEIEKDFSCTLAKESVSSINRCGPEWYLDFHWDQVGSDGELLATFSGNPTRDISNVIYFSQDFSGGQLSFPNLDINIEPVAGSVVYFPSTKEYEHEVAPILSGFRYTSAGFWHMLKKGM